MRRIWALTRYFIRTLSRSFSGAILLLGTLAYWFILFDPQQKTPSAAYYLLVIALFGAAASFAVATVVSVQAGKAHLYAWLVRLPSRVEFVTAVLLATLIVTFTLQLLLALLALINGPPLSVWQLLTIPPIWVSLIVLMAVLGLHASDLVTRGWSRVYIFGLLALFLVGQNFSNNSLRTFLNRLSQASVGQSWTAVGDGLANYAFSLESNSSGGLGHLFSLLFWPFRAIAEATVNGYFTNSQAWAPAVLLLYATLLFVIAADLFSNKDLIFVE